MDLEVKMRRVVNMTERMSLQNAHTTKVIEAGLADYERRFTLLTEAVQGALAIVDAELDELRQRVEVLERKMPHEQHAELPADAR